MSAFGEKNKPPAMRVVVDSMEVVDFYVGNAPRRSLTITAIKIGPRFGRKQQVGPNRRITVRPVIQRGEARLVAFVSHRHHIITGFLNKQFNQNTEYEGERHDQA
jgi:hypothetical protein